LFCNNVVLLIDIRHRITVVLMLQCWVRMLSVTLYIVTKRCVLELKLLVVYNRLVPK